MDQFDSLKREATKLERNLEDKVARYQQVSYIFTLVISADDGVEGGPWA